MPPHPGAGLVLALVAALVVLVAPRLLVLAALPVVPP